MRWNYQGCTGYGMRLYLTRCTCSPTADDISLGCASVVPCSATESSHFGLTMTMKTLTCALTLQCFSSLSLPPLYSGKWEENWQPLIYSLSNTGPYNLGAQRR